MAEEPKEVEIKVSDTEVFKGATLDEAAKKLAEAKAAASDAIKQREEENRLLREELQKRQPVQQQQPQEGAFNSGEYYRLFAIDPLQAQNYIDSFRLHVKPEEVQQSLDWIVRQGQVVEAHNESAQFHGRCPDFPGTKEAADELTKRMEESNRDWTADMLQVTWYELRDGGKIKPLEVSKEQLSTSPNQPPPSLGSGGGQSVSADQLTQFSNMTVEQQEDYMRKIGMMK